MLFKKGQYKFLLVSLRYCSHKCNVQVPSIPCHPKQHDEAWVKRIVLNPVIHTIKEENRYAIFSSYCGKNYFGSAFNSGCNDKPTVEAAILTALIKAGFIKDVALYSPSIYKFDKASRTDKGVSAVQHVISITMLSSGDHASEINRHLPDDIRVFKVIQTGKAFYAKTWCDARQYSYMTPTFAFAPIDDITTEQYRISSATLAELKEILDNYHGSKSYHNFTKGKSYGEKSAQRNIRSVSCSDPFIRDGLEWIIVKFEADSFMLYQIRKMIGLAMVICKQLAPKDLIERVFSEDDWHIPLAPALGLVLEKISYHNYNKCLESNNVDRLINCDDVAEEIQSFRELFIDRCIVEEETGGRNMMKWLPDLFFSTLDCSLVDDAYEMRSRILKAKLLIKKPKCQDLIIPE